MAYGNTVGEAGAILANADAQRAQQFYNVLSQLYQNQQYNRGLGARMQESEAERAAKFFDIGQRREMSQKQLEAQAEALNKEIEADAQTRKETLAANLEVAKLQFAPGRVTGPLAVELERQKADKEAQNREDRFQSNMAASITDQANAALLPLKMAYHQDRQRASEKLGTLTGWPTIFGRARTPGSDKALAKEFEQANAEADSKFMIGVSDIQSRLPKGSEALVRFNPKLNRFEPLGAITSETRMVPGALPEEERFDSEAGLRSDQGLGLSRPSPVPSNLSQRRAIRNPTTGQLELVR